VGPRRTPCTAATAAASPTMPTAASSSPTLQLPPPDRRRRTPRSTGSRRRSARSEDVVAGWRAMSLESTQPCHHRRLRRPPARATATPLNHPITLASNFRGEEGVYSRTHGTPGWIGLEEAVGALEGGLCVSYSSGMAAAAAALFALAPKVLVLPTSSYLGRASAGRRSRAPGPPGGSLRRHRRHCGRRRGHPRCRRGVGGDADQPDARCRRRAGHLRRRLGCRCQGGGGQHVRHAHLCPPPRRRRHHRRAQRHQVHRRPQRPAHRPGHRRRRGHPRPVCCRPAW
jgi:hypothetical protein